MLVRGKSHGIRCDSNVASREDGGLVQNLYRVLFLGDFCWVRIVIE